ncbi:hypothetical protein Cgig2_021265 [Carnegiea gigantea]|uniref:La-related protein 6B n=1 Tax=Carnegiea gigantea TaxID=171969 RepID=A0A9Q1JZI9_9CARY|nr:hypothetical protein Cgig2_021265 [Carnegiea gigantea]
MADQSSEKTLDSAPSVADQTQSDQSQPQDAASVSDPPLTRNSSFSKLNAQAKEFVPMKAPVAAPRAADPRLMIAPPPPPPPPAMIHASGVRQFSFTGFSHRRSLAEYSRSSLKMLSYMRCKDEIPWSLVLRFGVSLHQMIGEYVEYYFSDVNLATTDHLIRFINKDPEGYVPISVVASFKKIKALISSNSQLASVLRNSTKLVVSEDGKKVKRLNPLTDMDELQARIIVAENLPEDHCHQNLMKIFSAVGSVKSIRTCQPQPSNNGASATPRPPKTENLYSNKLHAFVEYESVELAEKAVAELNDEDDWRSGLRVRLLLKRGSKPAPTRGKKAVSEADLTCEEEDASTSEQNQNEKQSEDPSGQSDVQSHDHGEEPNLDKEGGQKKGRNRGRGKGRGRGQHQNQNQHQNQHLHQHPHHHHHHQTNKGNHVGAPPAANAGHGEQPKQQPPGPRMPDGTRGFSMGRGKPLTVNTA